MYLYVQYRFTSSQFRCGFSYRPLKPCAYLVLRTMRASPICLWWVEISEIEVDCARYLVASLEFNVFGASKTIFFVCSVSSCWFFNYFVKYLYEILLYEIFLLWSNITSVKSVCTFVFLQFELISNAKNVCLYLVFCCWSFGCFCANVLQFNNAVVFVLS